MEDYYRRGDTKVQPTCRASSSQLVEFERSTLHCGKRFAGNIYNDIGDNASDERFGASEDRGPQRQGFTGADFT